MTTASYGAIAMGQSMGHRFARFRGSGCRWNRRRKGRRRGRDGQYPDRATLRQRKPVRFGVLFRWGVLQDRLLGCLPDVRGPGKRRHLHGGGGGQRPAGRVWRRGRAELRSHGYLRWKGRLRRLRSWGGLPTGGVYRLDTDVPWPLRRSRKVRDGDESVVHTVHVRHRRSMPEDGLHRGCGLHLGYAVRLRELWQETNRCELRAWDRMQLDHLRAGSLLRHGLLGHLQVGARSPIALVRASTCPRGRIPSDSAPTQVPRPAASMARATGQARVASTRRGLSVGRIPARQGRPLYSRALQRPWRVPGRPPSSLQSVRLQRQFLSGQVHHQCGLRHGLRLQRNDMRQEGNWRRLCTTAVECASGYCEQGYCCNTGCAAACVACNLPSTLGTCSPISAGQSPSLTTQCVAAAATTCGNDGTCNGAGACRQHIAGTVCGPAACTGSTLTSARTCDGAGLCRPGTRPGAIRSVVRDGRRVQHHLLHERRLPSPSTCVSMSCGKKPNGATCAIATECNSGVCAQGVCCSTACAGTCKSCALSGSAGTCANVPAGQTPTPATQCVDGGATACGNDGTCDGNGACRAYVSGTLCAGATCNSGTYTAARLCDGAGTCASASSSSCGVYVCDTSTKVCKTTCSTNADCASPNICNGGTCSKKDSVPLAQSERSATRASAPKGCAVPARAPARASPAHGPEAPAPVPTSPQAKVRLLRPSVSTLAL